MIYYQCSFYKAGAPENEQLYNKIKREIPPEYTILAEEEMETHLLSNITYTPKKRKYTIDGRVTNREVIRISTIQSINLLTGDIKYLYEVEEQYVMKFLPDAIQKQIFEIPQGEFTNYLTINNTTQKSNFNTLKLTLKSNIENGVFLTIVLSKVSKSLTAFFRCRTLDGWQKHKDNPPKFLEELGYRSTANKANIDEITATQEKEYMDEITLLDKTIEVRKKPVSEREKPLSRIIRKKPKNTTNLSKKGQKTTKNAQIEDGGEDTNYTSDQEVINKVINISTSPQQVEKRVKSSTTQEVKKSTGLYEIGSMVLKPVSSYNRRHSDDDNNSSED